MRSSTYMTRALQSRDPRYVDILRKLGHQPETGFAPRQAKPAESDDFDIDYLRAAYLEQKGEEPDKRWGAARLKRELGLED